VRSVYQSSPNFKRSPYSEAFNKLIFSIHIIQKETGYIALSCGLDDLGFESRQGLGVFLFTTASGPALGHARLPIQWVRETLSLGIKRPRREGDHSPPSSNEAKNEWSYTSMPQFTFMAWELKVQGQLYFLPLHCNYTVTEVWFGAKTG